MSALVKRIVSTAGVMLTLMLLLQSLSLQMPSGMERVTGQHLSQAGETCSKMAGCDEPARHSLSDCCADQSGLTCSADQCATAAVCLQSALSPAIDPVSQQPCAPALRLTSMTLRPPFPPPKPV